MRAVLGVPGAVRAVAFACPSAWRPASWCWCRVICRPLDNYCESSLLLQNYKLLQLAACCRKSLLTLDSNKQLYYKQLAYFPAYGFVALVKT